MTAVNSLSTSLPTFELQPEQPEVILSRIEDLLLQILESISQGNIPVLQVVNLMHILFSAISCASKVCPHTKMV